MELTWRGELCTISTASWLLRCSQSPSEARIINSSSGLSRVTVTDGSALRIGLVKGSATLNLGSKGSLLNSALLRYASPIDFVTWLKLKTHFHVSFFFTSWYQLVFSQVFVMVFYLDDAFHTPHTVLHHKDVRVIRMHWPQLLSRRLYVCIVLYW